MINTNYPNWCEISIRSVLYRINVVEDYHTGVGFSDDILRMCKVRVDGLCKKFVESSATQGTSTTRQPPPHTHEGFNWVLEDLSQGCGVTLNFGTWEKTEINNSRSIVGNQIGTLIPSPQFLNAYSVFKTQCCERN